MRAERQILLGALTLYMEAWTEGQAGMSMVAHVISNRMKKEKRSLTDVIFRAFQFSCWNTGSATLMHLDDAPDSAIDLCIETMWDAMVGLSEDPTKGATHYLNEALTRSLRTDGTLPSWFDETKVTVRHKQHTFLIA